jgi:hypothetical protein
VTLEVTVTRATAIRATTILLQVALRATFRVRLKLLQPSDPAHITLLPDNEANNICYTQCISPDDVYEVGQIQTQAGTDPSYDTECEFSDQMVECSTAGD